MGLMDFLKKKDTSLGGEMDFNTANLTNDNTGLPPSTMNGEYQLDSHDANNFNNPAMNMHGMGNPSQFGQQSFQQQSSGSGMEKDMQLISLKLDAIKSELDAMNQRLKNLESIAEREQAKSSMPKKWY